MAEPDKGTECSFNPCIGAYLSLVHAAGEAEDGYLATPQRAGTPLKASKNVKSAYYYAEGLYLLSFVDRNVTYVFDLQYLTADKQTPRVTKWTFADNRHPASLIYSEDYGLLVGQHTGRVAGYEGYYDVDYDGSSVYTSNPYTGSLSTVWMSLSPDLERASILKRLIMVISGGQGTDIGLRLYKDFELSPKLSPTFKLNLAHIYFLIQRQISC